MTNLRQVAQQALEALKSAAIFVDSFRGQKATQEAITALQDALEQPEQEPTCPECKAAVLYECVACSSNNYPPKPEQVDCPRCGHVCSQRPWVGLTDEEIGKAWSVADGEHNASASVKRRITGAIEAKLKERNT